MTWWQHAIEVVVLVLRWLTKRGDAKAKKAKEIEDEIKETSGDPGRWTRIFERINRL